jgi:hypothetical protein
MAVGHLHRAEPVGVSVVAASFGHRAGPHHLTPHRGRVLAQRDEGGFRWAVLREESQEHVVASQNSSLVEQYQVGRSPQHTLKVGTVSEAWNATSQSLQALRGRSPSPRRHLESLEIARGDTGFVKGALGGRAPTRLQDGEEERDGRRWLRCCEGRAPHEASLQVVRDPPTSRSRL